LRKFVPEDLLGKFIWTYRNGSGFAFREKKEVILEMAYWMLILSLFSLTLGILGYTEIQPIFSSFGPLLAYPGAAFIIGMTLLYSSKKDSD
jgi:hypothetical protein